MVLASSVQQVPNERFTLYQNHWMIARAGDEERMGCGLVGAA